MSPWTVLRSLLAALLFTAMLAGPAQGATPTELPSGAVPAGIVLAQGATEYGSEDPYYGDVCLFEASPEQLADVGAYLEEYQVVTESEIPSNARVCVVEDDIVHYYAYSDNYPYFLQYYAMTQRAYFLLGPVELNENYLDPLDHTTMLLVADVDRDGRAFRTHLRHENSLEEQKKTGHKITWKRNRAKDGAVRVANHKFGASSTVVPVTRETRETLGARPANLVPGRTTKTAGSTATPVVPKRDTATDTLTRKYAQPSAPVRTADKAVAEPSSSKPAVRTSGSSTTPRVTQSVVRSTRR